ncbi:hypothetical protein FKG94_08510 [Exilibacterium tricleocarpae]|uniref:Uncharacterized protein n=1 Tax=Exilibacterium tricleocarpae TaxID=2591008 RepID=A0A545TVY1_9GAMM|nr:hypothetical protein FKG94_08510 [Exilibacterium tricleocarpae]
MLFCFCVYCITTPFAHHF